MVIFSKNTRLELEEEKRLLGVTSLEVDFSVTKKTKHYNVFSNYTPGYLKNLEKIKKTT